MPTQTVGFGFTHPGIGVAIIAGTAGDTLEIHEQNAFGSFIYNESVLVNKDLILESFDHLFKWTCRFIRANANCTIRDAIGGPSRFFGVFLENQTASTVLIDGCFFFSPDGVSGNRLGITTAVGSTVTVQNSVFWWFISAIQSNTDGTTILNIFHCTIVDCATGVNLQGGPVHDISNNLFVNNVNPVVNFVTGSNNAATGTAPGTSSVDNLTTTELGLARDFSPPTTNQFPFDFRGIEARMSRYKDAGVSKGVTTDYNGRTRSGTTPNIGATEGFDGFGAIQTIESVALAVASTKVTLAVSTS